MLRTATSADITAFHQTQLPVAKGFDARRSFFTIRHNGWVSFLARSKDLATWELSPMNPILEAGPGEGINNSDVDLFEWEGRTWLYYATGDQATWGSLRVAMYAGPMKTFYESCFPADEKLVTVSAKTK